MTGFRSIGTTFCFIVMCSTSFAQTPAAPQTSAATSSAVQSALSASYSAVLNGSTYGMTCDGDVTLGADGNTADTDAMISTIAAAAALPQGAEIVLPTGQCEFNREIDIPVAASIRLTGAGIGLTRLEFFTPNFVPNPVGNGLVFSVDNGANLTVDDFTVNRRLGSNLGTTFIGAAITITAGNSAPQAGNVVATNLDIYPAFANAQTDSWNTGLLETNISGPLISNVTISMPGWSHLADPSGYQCASPGSGPGPCAIHALPSPANPVAEPANLGFGAATGIALQGAGGGNFAIDSVVDGVTVTGGLVGLDLAQFQGAYVVDSKFASTTVGIRADSPATVSELLSVSNSLFTTTVGGIYSNGIGGVQITGNYFQPADAGTTNLPDYYGIWSRNEGEVTLSGNNLLGSGGAASPEYGIWTSADSYDPVPVTITGNTLYGFAATGSVCLGNDDNARGINATGNSLLNCAVPLADGSGLNAYADNSFGTPEMYASSNGDITLPQNLTVGSFRSVGSLSLQNDGQTMFSVDGSGNVTATGNVTTQGTLAASTVSAGTLATAGPLVFSGNNASSYKGAQEVVGNFFWPGNPGNRIITLNAPSGAFPAVTAGLATIYGELTCTGANATASWHVVGHYTASNGSLTRGPFSATLENDADSQAYAALGGGATIKPSANPNALGLQVAFGPGINATSDCSAMLSMMVTD